MVVDNTNEATTTEDVVAAAVTVKLEAVDAAVVDQSGVAILTETAEGVEVELTLSAMDAEEVQPAHIHEGSCPGVGTVAYALTSVINGASMTLIPDVTMADLVEMFPLAINIHKSAEETTVYTACGSIEI